MFNADVGLILCTPLIIWGVAMLVYDFLGMVMKMNSDKLDMLLFTRH